MRWLVLGALGALFSAACGGSFDGTQGGDDGGGDASDAADTAKSGDVSVEAGDETSDTSPIFTTDGGVECTVGGVLGSCLDVSQCTGDLVATPGHCPGPANIQCCTIRAQTGDTGVVDDAPATTDGWCPTDPTARPNEGLKEAAGDPGCPSGMLKIPASSALPSFCVDRYEAEIVLVNGDGSESSWSPYYPPPDGQKFRAVSLAGAIPQAYVTGYQATTACEASGKRLCVNDEWLRACRGPNDYVYPYGNTREPGVCNDHRAEHPAIQCFDSSASWIWSNLTYPGIDQQADTVDPTGSRTGCVTTEGAFDMMGNVHEWIYDDPSQYADPVKNIDFRGGYYVDTVENGNGCLYQTTLHTFAQWDYSIGFRCCADAS